LVSKGDAMKIVGIIILLTVAFVCMYIANSDSTLAMILGVHAGVFITVAVDIWFSIKTGKERDK
jgi:hypothetical protein